jgi:Cof subfamily protein (haloacid dehalogenase superfamily)
MQTSLIRPIRLAAIDIDGTLIGPDHVISYGNRRAIERLQNAGVEVALASRRHYQTMRPFTAALPGIYWQVSAQGCEVSDVDRRHIVQQKFMEPVEARRVVEMGCARGFATVIYATDGIFVDHDEATSRFYSEISGQRPVTATIEESLAKQIFKIIWIGEPAEIAALSSLDELDTLMTEKVRTHQRLFEFLPPRVNKGTGVAALAEHLGISADEVVGFGDAENDIPLFAWAGTSVAMPHGWSKAIERATMVAPLGPVETALARGIELLFVGRQTALKG